MAGVVHINWYATGFRGDKLGEVLAEVSPIAVRYGATSYSVLRSLDDRYQFQQAFTFEEKLDWERFWNGPEMIRMRTVTSGWWQVPIVYVWHEIVCEGQGPSREKGDLPERAASPLRTPA